MEGRQLTCPAALSSSAISPIALLWSGRRYGHQISPLPLGPANNRTLPLRSFQPMIHVSWGRYRERERELVSYVISSTKTSSVSHLFQGDQPAAREPLVLIQFLKPWIQVAFLNWVSALLGCDAVGLFRNVGKQIYNKSASYSRRTDTTSTPLLIA
jgi:hypothetical protein